MRFYIKKLQSLIKHLIMLTGNGCYLVLSTYVDKNISLIPRKALLTLMCHYLNLKLQSVNLAPRTQNLLLFIVINRYHYIIQHLFGHFGIVWKRAYFQCGFFTFGHADIIAKFCVCFLFVHGDRIMNSCRYSLPFKIFLESISFSVFHSYCILMINMLCKILFKRGHNTFQIIIIELCIFSSFFIPGLDIFKLSPDNCSLYLVKPTVYPYLRVNIFF